MKIKDIKNKRILYINHMDSGDYYWSEKFIVEIDDKYWALINYQDSQSGYLEHFIESVDKEFISAFFDKGCHNRYAWEKQRKCIKLEPYVEKEDEDSEVVLIEKELIVPYLKDLPLMLDDLKGKRVIGYFNNESESVYVVDLGSNVSFICTRNDNCGKIVIYSIAIESLFSGYLTQQSGYVTTLPKYIFDTDNTAIIQYPKTKYEELCKLSKGGYLFKRKIIQGAKDDIRYNNLNGVKNIYIMFNREYGDNFIDNINFLASQLSEYMPYVEETKSGILLGLTDVVGIGSDLNNINIDFIQYGSINELAIDIYSIDFVYINKTFLAGVDKLTTTCSEEVKTIINERDDELRAIKKPRYGTFMASGCYFGSGY